LAPWWDVGTGTGAGRDPSAFVVAVPFTVSLDHLRATTPKGLGGPTGFKEGAKAIALKRSVGLTGPSRAGAGR